MKSQRKEILDDLDVVSLSPYWTVLRKKSNVTTEKFQG
jgi:hypothetical protein